MTESGLTLTLDRDASDLDMWDLRVTNDPRSLRLEAVRCVRFLMEACGQPAVLLARECRSTDGHFGFEYLKLYEDIAAEAHGYVASISRPFAGGIEHLLFAVRHVGVTAEECLACLTEGTG